MSWEYKKNCYWCFLRCGKSQIAFKKGNSRDSWIDWKFYRIKSRGVSDTTVSQLKSESGKNV